MTSGRSDTRPGGSAAAVLGVDPGLAATGVALVRGCGRKVLHYSFGVIRTPGNAPLPDRLNLLYTEIETVITDERPDLVAVEDVFFKGRHPNSGILLGKVIGVVLLAAGRCGVPAVEISVREVKKILTGNGNAGKDQVEAAIRSLLRRTEPIRPDHASDAAAVAVCGILRYGGAFPNRETPGRAVPT